LPHARRLEKACDFLSGGANSQRAALPNESKTKGTLHKTITIHQSQRPAVRIESEPSPGDELPPDVYD